MPWDITDLPSAPTSDQVAKFVADAAAEVIGAVTQSATTAQDHVEDAAAQAVGNVGKAVEAVNTAAQTALTDLRTGADRAKREVRETANKSIADFQALVQQLLPLVGQPPAAADFAIGDVNGEVFFEPMGCFLLFMKALQENRNPIKVRLREPAVVTAFEDFVGATQDQIAARLREKLIPRIQSTPRPATVVDPATVSLTTILAAVPPAVWIILAVAVLVLAVAASLFVVLMAVAIIFAIYKGYDIENVRLEHTSPLGGLTFGADFRNN